MDSSWWDRLRRRLRPTVDSVIDDLRDGNGHRREHAAIWVWSRGRGRFSGDERARLIEAMTPLATGAHHPVTSAQAVAALVALDADGAVELALTALRDPRTEVRHIVAAQLAPTGDRRVVSGLVELLDDADGFVREAATIGLQSQGARGARAPARDVATRTQGPRRQGWSQAGNSGVGEVRGRAMSHFPELR
jgi:HEAT repeat protein